MRWTAFKWAARTSAYNLCDFFHVFREKRKELVHNLKDQVYVLLDPYITICAFNSNEMNMAVRELYIWWRM